MYQPLNLFVIACVLLGCVGFNSGDRVTRIGNQVKASASGVDVRGAVFLMNDIILVDGVVFAFSAFFRSSAAVQLQIWRPVVNGTVENELELIYQLRVVASVLLNREDVYIESRLVEDCVAVQSGDRLGVYFEEGPGAVSYFFDPRTPTALGHTLNNDNETYTVGKVVGFDSLTFPYDFSLAAYVDTSAKAENTSDILVECPKGLLIPPEPQVTLPPTTPSPPITGVPGATGGRGKPGVPGDEGKMGATGQQGIDGEQGATGKPGLPGWDGEHGEGGEVGATGSKGTWGGTGATGPAGEKGDDGPRGPAGPPAVEPSGAPVTTKSSSLLKNPLMMALLIWLIVVTIVAIALIISILIIICYETTKQAAPMEMTKTAFAEDLKRQSSSIYPPELAIDVDSWLDTMKDQSVTSMDPVFIDVRSGNVKAPITEFAEDEAKPRNSIYAPFAEQTIEIDGHRKVFNFDPSDQDSGIASDAPK